MKKIYSILIAFMALNVSSASAETVELSTYYPAPFGVYDRLRLVPRPVLGLPCQIGTMYVETPDSLRYCMDDGTGTGMWGFFKQGGVWTQEDINGTTAYIYPSEMAQGGPHTISVGIGIMTPAVELHIAGGNDTTLRLEETVGGAFTDIVQMGSDGESRLSRSGTGGPDVVIKPNGDVVLAEATGRNVGIGAAAAVPLSKLDIDGDVRLLPDGTARSVYWGTGTTPRLQGQTGLAYMQLYSDHDTSTQLRMRDKQSTLYGYLYGSGDGRYFGLLDGLTDTPATANWFVLYDDLDTQQNVQLRSGSGAEAIRLRAYSANTGGGRIDVRIGGAGAALDDLRLGYTGSGPSGYYATYAP